MGVVAAAMLAGLVSLISLIISKENKVSEFRQARIDAQRADLADLLAAAMALTAAPRDNRSEYLLTFNACYARILLRDNPRPSIVIDERFVHRIKRRWIGLRRRNWRQFRLGAIVPIPGDALRTLSTHYAKP